MTPTPLPCGCQLLDDMPGYKLCEKAHLLWQAAHETFQYANGSDDPIAWCKYRDAMAAYFTHFKQREKETA